ncbi:MAG: FHA domain-containing protein [Limisphaerales bacterium]
MIQLFVLTGSAAGQSFSTNQFPVSIGRNSNCSLVISEPGIFEQHFEIHFSPEGFILQANNHAVVYINDSAAESSALRNGDVIKAGLAKIQFSLGSMIQRGLRVREALTWFIVATVTAAQVYLLFRLLAIAR